MDKPRTRYTKNEIIVEKDIAKMWLYDNHGERKGFTILDATDVPKAQSLKWCLTRAGYAQATYPNRGKTVLLHQLITGKRFMDHANGNKLDNRSDNLREANARQNTINRRCYGRSGVKGVYPTKSHNKPWIVRVWLGHDNLNVGAFEDFEEAQHVYHAVAQQILGTDYRFVRR